MKFKGFLILLLDLALGILKPLLWVYLIYSVNSSVIEERYNSKVNMGFVMSAAEERADSYNNLRLFTDVSIGFIVFFVLAIWIIVLVLMHNKMVIPAGILSVIFLSIVGGILLLTVYRKELLKKEAAKKAANKVESPKPEIKKVEPDNSCPYCDRVLEKDVIICPYCGAHRHK